MILFLSLQHSPDMMSNTFILFNQYMRIVTSQSRFISCFIPICMSLGMSLYIHILYKSVCTLI